MNENSVDPNQLASWKPAEHDLHFFNRREVILKENAFWVE